MDETSNEDKKSYRKITIKTPSLESNDQDKLKYVNVHNILQQINSQHFNQIGSKNNVQSSRKVIKPTQYDKINKSDNKSLTVNFLPSKTSAHNVDSWETGHKSPNFTSPLQGEALNTVDVEYNIPYQKTDKEENSSTPFLFTQNNKISPVYDKPPVTKNEEWVSDLASDYDLCIVFPAEKGDFKEEGRKYITCFRQLGFDLFIYRGLKDKDEIFVLIRAPLQKLRDFADFIDFEMCLDEQNCKAQLERGNSSKGIKPIIIPHRPEFTSLRPHQNIYAKYSNNVDESLYWRETRYDNPFRKSIRLKLSTLLLESRPPGGGEPLQIEKDIYNGYLKACFPLHSKSAMKNISHQWLTYPFNNLPIEEIKEYYGEKIAMYFSFMHHYNCYGLIPALVGLPFQIAIFVLNNYSAPFLPFFSVILALWSVTMLEMWKRQESSIAFKWGMDNFEENERDRPEFQGEKEKSIINGTDVIHFPKKARFNFIVQSYTAIGTLAVLVLGITVAIYVVRYTIKTFPGFKGTSNAQTLCSILNALVIIIFDAIYSKVATYLTNKENHRTDTDYEDSMIVKLFVFQCISSYSSFFYVAFIAYYLGDCAEQKDCMSSLTINLAVIFVVKIIVENIFELLIPYVAFKMKYNKAVANLEGKITRPEIEYQLEPYDMIQSSLADYCEVVIRFGFNSLFSSALPISSLLALIANAIEIRCDGWKLMNAHQRPFPRGCEDIGSWQIMFLFISIVSVVTNAALIVFCMDVLPLSYSLNVKYWIFILFQWFLFSIQGLLVVVIPDVPEEINIQKKRTTFIVSKLIDQVSDDYIRNDEYTDKPIEFSTYPLVGGFFRKNV